MPSPPKRGLSPGALIGIIAAALVLLGVLATAVVLVVLPVVRKSVEPATVVTEPLPATEASTVPATPATDVFDSAEAAVRATLPADYVLKPAEATPERAVFWAGPPNSEWDTVIVAETADGGWRVTSTTPLNSMDSGSANVDADGADEASALVSDFLAAIKDDRPDDAQSLTIAPLHDDPASAQVSNGQFSSFTIDRVEPRDDGTSWVYTSEVWAHGTDRWRYEVVPTEAGLRIRSLEPPDGS